MLMAAVLLMFCFSALTGVAQALECYNCTYKMPADNANTDGCQGGDDFNTTALMSDSCDHKCFVS